LVNKGRTGSVRVRLMAATVDGGTYTEQKLYLVVHDTVIVVIQKHLRRNGIFISY
jgi:hypothetical protein